MAVMQELGEPGIGGVTVTIGVDLNGDGAHDFYHLGHQ